MPKKSSSKKSDRTGSPTRTPIKEHPALASAKRAIRRGLPRLTAEQVFHVAAVVDTMQYGEDRGRWALSVSYAADQPEYHWRCDEPIVTQGGTR